MTNSEAQEPHILVTAKLILEKDGKLTSIAESRWKRLLGDVRPAVTQALDQVLMPFNGMIIKSRYLDTTLVRRLNQAARRELVSRGIWERVTLPEKKQGGRKPKQGKPGVKADAAAVDDDGVVPMITVGETAYRRHGQEVAFPDESRVLDRLLADERVESDPYLMAVRAVARDDLDSFLAGETARDRTIMTLKWRSGMSNAEISEMVSIDYRPITTEGVRLRCIRLEAKFKARSEHLKS